MKRKYSLGLALAAMVLASPLAAAAAAMDEIETVATDDMDRLRGGSEADDVAQGNVSTTNQSNTAGGTTISGHSSKINGAIGSATVSGTHGIVSQMINSGDNNIMNAGTNINIYMK